MNISFSRCFPAYHPRKGQRTGFIEKIWHGLDFGASFSDIYELNSNKPAEAISLYNDLLDNISEENEGWIKHHTIRNGHRWKPGMKFKPVCWSGKPYASKVIQFAPEIEVVKTFDISVSVRGDHKEFSTGSGIITPIETLAKNDGLYVNDFLSWFNKPFSGQIICWDKSIEY